MIYKYKKCIIICTQYSFPMVRSDRLTLKIDYEVYLIMKRYTIELTDELSHIYEDIAKMNHKEVEECLSIILERVICTMLNNPGANQKNPSK